MSVVPERLSINPTFGKRRISSLKKEEVGKEKGKKKRGRVAMKSSSQKGASVIRLLSVLKGVVREKEEGAAHFGSGRKKGLFFGEGKRNNPADG